MELINLKLVFIVVFILLFIIYIIPIYIKAEFKRKNQEDKINIRIVLLKGLIKFNYEISYLDLVFRHNEPILKVKGKIEEKNTEKTFQNIKDRLRLEEIIENYKDIKKYIDIFSDTFRYILNKISISSLSCTSKIGLGDAALTGIAYGTAWIIVGTLLNIILNQKDVKEMSINLYPDFNENILEFDFFCIIKLKIVHIIIAGLKGIKVFIKGGVLNA